MAHKYYLERKAKGLCVVCGKVPAREGRTQCQECTDGLKQQKQHLREMGVCPYCRNSIKAGEIQCASCVKKRKENQNKPRSKRTIDKVSVCQDCNATYYGWAKRCKACNKKAMRAHMAQYNRECYEQRKNQGLCVICGAPHEKQKLYCDACVARRQELWIEKKRNKKKQQKCLHCTKPNVPGTSYCVEHKAKLLVYTKAVQAVYKATNKELLEQMICRLCRKQMDNKQIHCEECKAKFRACAAEME